MPLSTFRRQWKRRKLWRYRHEYLAEVWRRHRDHVDVIEAATSSFAPLLSAAMGGKIEPREKFSARKFYHDKYITTGDRNWLTLYLDEVEREGNEDG